MSTEWGGRLETWITAKMGAPPTDSRDKRKDHRELALVAFGVAILVLLASLVF